MLGANARWSHGALKHALEILAFLRGDRAGSSRKGWDGPTLLHGSFPCGASRGLGAGSVSAWSEREIWHEEGRAQGGTVSSGESMSAGRVIQLRRSSQKGTASLGFHVLIGCHLGGFGRLL
jgi:hypothetical protein